MTEPLVTWKDFPCRNCLMKHDCNKTCFETPRDSAEPRAYISEHGLQGICLACGGPREKHFYWACRKCDLNIIRTC